MDLLLGNKREVPMTKFDKMEVARVATEHYSFEMAEELTPPSSTPVVFKRFESYGIHNSDGWSFYLISIYT